MRDPVDHCRWRSASGALPGLRGNGRTAPWSCTHHTQSPNAHDVDLRESDITLWVASHISGSEHSIADKPPHVQTCLHVVAAFNSGWIPLFLECVTADSPTPLVTELLACWVVLAKKVTNNPYRPRGPPTDDARKVLAAAVNWAMSEYNRLGDIWKAC